MLNFVPLWHMRLKEYITHQFISHPLQLHGEGKSYRRKRSDETKEKGSRGKKTGVRGIQRRNKVWRFSGLGGRWISSFLWGNPTAVNMWIETKAEMQEPGRSQASFGRKVFDRLIMCTGDMENLDKYIKGRKMEKLLNHRKINYV